MSNLAPMFRSSRSVDLIVPEPVLLPQTSRTSILIVSENNGLCQMVRVALEQGETQVQTERRSIADLVALGATAVADHGVVVFEARPSDPAEMSALRALIALAPPSTRFMAMTDEMLSLAQARLLMDAGVEEVLPLSSIRPNLRQAVELEAEVPSPRGIEPKAVSSRKGVVIAVARARGGSGATTIAVNIAALLAKGKGGKVVLLDLDLQHGNAGFYLDVEDQGAFIGLIKDRTIPDSTFLRTAVIEHRSGLHILPAPNEFAPLTALTPDMVGGLLDALQCDYDHVIVDLPNALVDWIEPVLSRAARVLLVTDTSVPAIRQARRLLDVFTEDNLALPVEIVINQEKRPFVQSAAQKEAARVLDRTLTHWVPRDDKATRAAIDRGAPLLDAAPRSATTKALRRLADDIIAQPTAHQKIA